MERQQGQIDVMIAEASHEVYVDTILETIREAAKKRGTGIAERTHEYVAQKMKEGKAVIKENLNALSFALATASLTIGASSAMLVGDYAAMDDEFYAMLNEMLLSMLPKWKKDFVAYKSIAGEGGTIEGACHAALDHFFYKKNLLESLKTLEAL